MGHIGTDAPHQRNLRTGRVSLPGAWYAITTCVEGRRPLLVANPEWPGETGWGAEIALETVRWLHDRGRWRCLGYCVMPDHLHLVVELGEGWSLPKALNTFKSFTARGINGLLKQSGRVWQRGYYDHALRRAESWEAVVRYALENPVRKGFADRPEAWPWSGLGAPPEDPGRVQERRHHL